MVTRLEGRIVTPHGVREGALVIDGDRIARVDEGKAPRRLLVPGFVDLHVHGGGGHDAMDGEAGVRGLARFHLGHGTTSLCPTTVTSPEASLTAAIAGIGAAAAAPDGGARILGAHVEGPFISSRRLGAQPPRAVLPELGALERLLAAGPVAIVTLAPELEGARALIELLSRRGIRASLGHSDATYDEARAGFAAGADGATHLYNAMSGLAHRAPGLAAAALEAEGATLEVILDGHHVHPAMFRLALAAARGRLALVTDAIRAAGLGEGESELGGQKVRVEGGRATLADGTLAGSILTLDVAVQNAVHMGCPIAEAVRLAATNPAQALGRRDLGRLEAGALADVVELDETTLEVRRVWVGGREMR